jgi:hypothetical protein
MANEILSYLEMCQREGVNLQKGMNYFVRAITWPSATRLSRVPAR